MGIRDAKPEVRDGKGGGMKVEIDDTDNPLPAEGEKGQTPDPPPQITGKP
jgi:hypothetical protein